ncbi:probable protein S-acyltransferase 15 isoform X4 [Dendrobium catenatum]|uniref:probable protein S-acyltransferase 15 isoform X4 n=1 Tax=Dendrobium catenatum TaxID=906689 RepID=UPI0010A003E0|nr:probable protein S-acyltransferase 15 isoform X4 [Dendrobium catenatum]
MGYVYCTTVFVFLQDWVALNSSLGLTNAIIFSFLAFMCLIAFFASVFIDPGGVPSSFAPEMENPQTKKGKSQYCDKCCAYKPPQTHHCRVCRRCVLKMDHHCSWIGNCVGYANYKSFISCIFYGSVASIYSAVIFFCDTLHREHGFRSSKWFGIDSLDHNHKQSLCLAHLPPIKKPNYHRVSGGGTSCMARKEMRSKLSASFRPRCI